MCNDDDWNVAQLRVLDDLARCHHLIEQRHIKIHKQKIWINITSSFGGILAIVCVNHAIAVQFENMLHLRPRVVLIVNHQNHGIVSMRQSEISRPKDRSY